MEIYNLYDIPEDKLPFCGGKAARLSILGKAGFPVPPGFLLCSPQTDQDLAAAADYFTDSGLTCVAVRSSATSEDGALFSSAGQYETVLNVTEKNDFQKAVNTCLDSLHTSTAKSYQAFMGTEAQNTSMSVLVQQMVDARCAGVAFSKDPLDPQYALIEAVSGLGESLVSGKKTAAQYHVADDRSVKADSDLLTETQVLEIYDTTLTIAEHFGFTADVEWAIDGNGRLYILQVRPVTTEDVPELDEFDPKTDLTDHVITNCNISEMMPGAITPLTLTTSANGLDYGLRYLLIHSGVYKSEEEIPPYSCYFTLSGHLFGDLTPIYAIGKTMVMASKESIDLSICGRVLDSQVPDDVPSPILPRRIFNFYRYISAVMGKGKACKNAERIASALTISPGRTPKESYAAIDAQMPQFMNIMYYHYLTSAFSGMMSSALNLQLAPFFEDETEQHAAVAACLVDIPGIESADLLNMFYALADEIKKTSVHSTDDETRSMVRMAKSSPHTSSAEQTAADPDSTSSGRLQFTAASVRKIVENDRGAIQELYRAFMKKHGHRSIDECEMRQKSLRDDLETFYTQLALVCNAEDRKETAADWQKNRDDLLSHVPSSKAAALKMLVKYSREGVRVREYTKSRIVKVTYKFKKAYEALAEQMVSAGLLSDTDCIYFLTHEEIGQLINENKTELSLKAIRRRRLYPQQQNLKFRDISFGKPEPLVFDGSGLNADSQLKGTPVSRGVIEGPAHIVKSVEDANNLKPGDIMVSEYTDTGWTPYYSQIGGLVTEIGAAISHGAVVAREYGLPLVSNIPNATDLIQDGDLLHLDGAAGIVTVIRSVQKQEHAG